MTAPPPTEEEKTDGVADTGGFMLAVMAGFAGLGSEVVYLKALDFAVGAAPTVRMTVVATFIVGTGVGALFSARVRRPWLAEVVAAGWALLWLLGFSSLVDVGGSFLAATSPTLGPNLAAAILGFAHLVVPALALGVALPAIAESEGDLGRVYAHHALGALLAILVFEAVVYPGFGLPGAWTVLAIAHLCVLWLWLQRRRHRPLPKIRLGVAAWPLLAVGIVTGGYQGAWLLVGALVFRPFYFVVPSVIGAFILGQAAGGALWRRTQHGFASAVRWSAIGAAVSSILAAGWLLLPRPQTPWGTAAALGLMLTPAAIPIGTLYPAWTRVAARTQTGGAMLSLSVGNAVGVFVGGGLLLSWLPALWVLALLATTLAVLARWQSPKTTTSNAAFLAVAAALAVAATTPDAAFFRGREGDAQRVESELVVRGPGELSAVYSTATATDRERRLHQSGYSPVNLDPARGLLAESTIGAFGALHAPRMKRALVLGAGSGRTAGFVATAFEHTDVVDVGSTVPALLAALHAENYEIQANPRVTYHPIDGVLAPHLFEAHSYDLIVHTLHPGYVDRAAKLYTQEYLQGLRSLLRTDGVLITWADVTLSKDANSVYQSTVASVFPQTRLYGVRPQNWDYGYYVLVASQGPPIARPEALRASSVGDDPATLALLATPLAQRQLPPLVGSDTIHSFAHPSQELLAGGFENHALAPCKGECSTHDTLTETQPCGPELAGTRTRKRVCTQSCTWGAWTELTECAP